MCGISGIVDFSGKLENTDRIKTAKTMNDKIVHRGPDDFGEFHDEVVSLGMRRLSIIDLVTGKQPIYSPDNKYLIFFNGEIYNYLDLKKEIEPHNYPFKTSSDTEVILASYLIFGKSFIEKLRGMFAFIIYDLENSSAIIGRDFFGEKPLYYYWDQHTLYFCSELHALVSAPQIPRTLSREAAHCYFYNGIIPEPLTMFENIFALPAGHFMEIKQGKIEIIKYRNDDFNDKKEKISDLNEAKEYIRPVFERSVKRQMISDVPLGAFLSGGIDSSTIVATMQKFSAKPVKTFTVKMEDQEYDESAIAREVSKKVGTEHHEIELGNRAFNDDYLYLILNHVGQPFSDTSAIPTFLITREIVKHVKVALSGDGGDEIFAGYSQFVWNNQIASIKRTPALARKILLKVLSGSAGLYSSAALRQMIKGLGLSLLEEDRVPAAIHKIFDSKEFQKLLRTGFKDEPEQFLSYYNEVRNSTSLRKIMNYRMTYNLPSNMLIKVDRMSMANSLEVRAPFLDIDLYHASLRLSDNLLLNNKTGKYIIREIMKEDLPGEVFSHPKTGFSISMSNFVNADFWKLIERYLHDKNSPVFKILVYDEVKELIAAVKGNAVSLSHASIYKQYLKLWSLLMFAAWVDMYNVEFPG